MGKLQKLKRKIDKWKKFGKILNGYEGLYQVSNLGRVKRLYKNHTKIMTCSKFFYNKINHPTDYYYRINLYKNRKMKSYFIHRLVAEAFIPNPDNLPVINHKDENKSNNNITNLEWCTQKYNSNYGTAREKLLTVQGRKRFIRCIETGIIYNSSVEAGKQTNSSAGAIRCVCLGTAKSAGGYHWEYVDKNNL